MILNTLVSQKFHAIKVQKKQLNCTNEIKGKQ